MNDGWYATPRLRQAIVNAGWNVRTLAAELGYSKSHLYNVVNGRMPVRRVVAQHIATLLGTDFFVLFALRDRNGE